MIEVPTFPTQPGDLGTYSIDDRRSPVVNIKFDINTGPQFHFLGAQLGAENRDIDNSATGRGTTFAAFSPPAQELVHDSDKSSSVPRYQSSRMYIPESSHNPRSVLTKLYMCKCDGSSGFENFRKT